MNKTKQQETPFKRILVTGGAGFIGFSVAKRIAKDFENVDINLADNLNDYYSTNLKMGRLHELGLSPNNSINHKILSKGNSAIRFTRIDLQNESLVKELFSVKYDVVIHLAAQAGVRYSATNPQSYFKSNIIGFFNVMNNAIASGCKLFMYASSSSVYGESSIVPFKESFTAYQPLSLYAATKLHNEHLASVYSQASNMPMVGLRFFNIYGPWGRPDMAYFKWAINIRNNEWVEIRDKGEIYRDMTYIDDATKSIVAIIKKGQETESMNANKHLAQHEIYNIGNSNPVKIADVFNFINSKLGPTNKIKYVKKGTDEPVKTYADTSKLYEYINFRPNTKYQDGLSKFLDWFIRYNFK